MKYNNNIYNEYVNDNKKNKIIIDKNGKNNDINNNNINTNILNKSNKNIYGNNNNGNGIHQKWIPGHGHGPILVSKSNNTDSTAPESVSINTNNINHIYKNCINIILYII